MHPNNNDQCSTEIVITYVNEENADIYHKIICELQQNGLYNLINFFEMDIQIKVLPMKVEFKKSTFLLDTTNNTNLTCKTNLKFIITA